MALYVRGGQTLFSPFYGTTISDPNPLNDTETATVRVSEIGLASLTKGNPGTVGDSALGSPPPSSLFTESGLVGTRNQPFAQTVFSRLYYNAPLLSNGQSDEVKIDLMVTDTAAAGNPTPSPVTVLPSSFVIDIVTAPLISGAVPDQPVAPSGSLQPYSKIGITDSDFDQTAKDTATITITDGGGSPTDKDGMLTGPGLSQFGPGRYAIVNQVSPSDLTAELKDLTFTTAPDSFFGVRVASLQLSVTDQPPPGATSQWYWSPLTSTDFTTSVRINGKPISITGLPATQNVMEGSTTKPFTSAIINDDSTNGFVSVTISQNGSGSLSAAGPLVGSATDVASALDNLVFTPGGGTSNTTFTLLLSDVGETSTVTTSVATQPRPLEPVPAVTGKAQEGQSLSVTSGDAHAAFQWQRLISGNWTDIIGAAGSSYTVAEADENNVLRVIGTGTNGSASSASTAKVTDVTPLVSVTVSGKAEEGEVLTATPTISTDSDSTGADVTYQWQRSVDGSAWTMIAGATASTYAVIEDDETDVLRVAVSFTDDTGQTATGVSSATAKVIDVAPTLAVSVTGTPQEGSVLSAIPLLETDNDGATAAVTYQWQRSTDSVAWNSIGGATASNYGLALADGDSFVRAVVSFTDDTGQVVTADSPAILIDALLCHGTHTQYLIALNPAGGAVVEDTVPGRDGTQTPMNLGHIRFADGIGRFDATGNAEEAARLYRAALGRVPDASGLDYWTAQLDSKTLGLNDVALDFIHSAEFNLRYGALDNQSFVQQLYQNVLGRAGESTGVQYWTGQLDAGVTRAQVLTGFSDSAENKTNTSMVIGDKDRGEAYRLYQAAFNRTPDSAGLNYWTSKLDQGVAPIQAALGFVNSSEFSLTFSGLTGTEFVNQMYQNVLHRAGETSGVQYWVGQLNAGASQAQVLLGFSDSLENKLSTSSATHDGWVYLGNAS